MLKEHTHKETYKTILDEGKKEPNLELQAGSVMNSYLTVCCPANCLQSQAY